MALSFIGKPISLISHSDVRYRGILAGIDTVASTIQLSNVYSMGTETRRPPAEFIPPVQESYQYIIFRASEVKDLAVDDPAPRRSVHDDPAVLGASAHDVGVPYPSYAPPPPVVGPPLPPPQAIPPPQYARTPQQPLAPPPIPPPPPPMAPVMSAAHTTGPAQQTQGRQQHTPNRRNSSNNHHHHHPHHNNNHNHNNNSVHSAAVSLETVERAIGDLRVSSAAASAAAAVAVASNGAGGAGSGGGGGRRSRGRGRGENWVTEIRVPATDFDFESSNAKFDKAALATASGWTASSGGVNGGDEARGEGGGGDEEEPEAGGGGGNENGEGKEKEKEKPGAYNPSKSFFDLLSSSTHPSISAGNEAGRGGRGRRGGGSGRSRQEEERKRNVATFGEPGGVGLMGPGAYVGGWGGYGRRGGRPRRGGGAAGGGGGGGGGGAVVGQNGTA